MLTLSERFPFPFPKPTRLDPALALTLDASHPTQLSPPTLTHPPQATTLAGTTR